MIDQEPVVTRTLLKTADRIPTTAKIFGLSFPQHVEPYAYTVAREMAPAYNGGYWHFYTLSNGGFYMAPDMEGPFAASCAMNYFEGELSADALGIVACLMAYSHLSFSEQEPLDRICSSQFHYLRSFAGSHREAAHIFRAID